MSTSYLVEVEIRRWCKRLGLRIELISADPFARDAEYRIHGRTDNVRPMPNEILFLGTMDRCSDFVRGYLLGGDMDNLERRTIS